jgi:hypothetical protein
MNNSGTKILIFLASKMSAENSNGGKRYWGIELQPHNSDFSIYLAGGVTGIHPTKERAFTIARTYMRQHL